MLRQVKARLLYVCCAVLMVSSAGCIPLIVGAAAGVSGYAWVSGAIEKEYSKPLSSVHKAVLRGLKSLDLAVDEDEMDKLTAKVSSEFSDGKNIAINLTAQTERSTKMVIRVGVFGDKVKSEMLLSAIERYL